MPLYEYRCTTCETLFETLVARVDDDSARCPRCGGTELARQLSVFAVPSSKGTAPQGPCGSPSCGCRRT